MENRVHNMMTRREKLKRWLHINKRTVNEDLQSGMNENLLENNEPL